MTDREAICRIILIMQNVMLIPHDGKPIPVKGTSRKDCYDALYKIQELLLTRDLFQQMAAAKELRRLQGEARVDAEQKQI